MWGRPCIAVDYPCESKLEQWGLQIAPQRMPVSTFSHAYPVPSRERTRAQGLAAACQATGCQEWAEVGLTGGQISAERHNATPRWFIGRVALGAPGLART
jgi:hypothetical protein